MPTRCLYVSRPSKWGNPFRIINDAIYIGVGWRRKVFSRWVLIDEDLHYDNKTAVELYRYLWTATPQGENPDLLHWVNHVQNLDLSELDNYDSICCWCKEDEICHGDVIIKMYKKYKENQLKTE